MQASSSQRRHSTGKSIHAIKRKKKVRHQQKASRIVTQIQIRPNMVKRHANMKIHKVFYDAISLPHTQNAFIGLSLDNPQTEVDTKANLISQGYQYVPAVSNERYRFISLT